MIEMETTEFTIIDTTGNRWANRNIIRAGLGLHPLNAVEHIQEDQIEDAMQMPPVV